MSASTIVIGLNGPPGCGKDFGVDLLRDYFIRLGMAPERVIHESLAKPLKQAVHTFLGLPLNHIPVNKDAPDPDYLGKIPRAAYIAFPENFVKPFFGSSTFGDLLIRRQLEPLPDKKTIILLSDSGFIEEIKPVAERLGKNRVLILRIHRHEHDFTNDSRSYLPNSRFYLSADVFNPGVGEALAYETALVTAIAGFADKLTLPF